MYKAAGICTSIALATVMAGVAGADTYYGDFNEETARVFADIAYIYETSDASGECICSLNPGTEVFILEQMDSLNLSGGLATPWVRIGFETVQDVSEGYVSGSSLALTSFDMESDTVFMFGLAGFGEDNFRFLGYSRIAAGGEIIAQCPFSPFDGGFGSNRYGYSVSSQPVDPTGLSGVINLVVVSFEYEACGFPNSEVPFLWTGTQLVVGPQAISQYEAGIYHYTTEILLPSHLDGEEERLILRSISEVWAEDTESYIEEEMTSTVFLWQDGEFTEVPSI